MKRIDLEQLEHLADHLIALREQYVAEMQEIETRVAGLRRLAEAATKQSATIVKIIDRLQHERFDSADWWKHGDDEETGSPDAC